MAWAGYKALLKNSSRQTIERRERAIMGAASGGIPNTRHEEWKYTSLRPLLESRFEMNSAGKKTIKVSSDIVERVKARLAPNAIPVVLVDGRLDLNWPGSDGLKSDVFRTLSAGESDEDSSWWEEWQSAAGMEQLFAGMAAGLAEDGILITLKNGQVLDRPIHIIHLSTGEQTTSARINRVVISVPEAAKLRVYEEFISARADSPDEVWNNTLTQLKLGPQADCGYYRVLSSAGSFHTGAVTAVLDKGSRLETFSLAAGARWARINVNIHYKAPDAQCLLDGLYLTRGSEHVDHHTTVDHEVGHCRTHQLYKGILADQSRAVFNGKVFIRKDAQGTEAYQTNKNLLLSSDAEVDTKPQLEIDANDVKASHGAAIGSINPAELFYLQSRCISRSDAMSMLCRGFADDVVMRVTDEVAKDLLTGRVRDWFKALSNSGEVIS